MDNCLFFYALKMVSSVFAFSCLESTFLGKYAYPVLTALETSNTLHIGGYVLKATQNNRSVVKPFFTGSDWGYNKHNFNWSFLADSDKPAKIVLSALAIHFVQS